MPQMKFSPHLILAQNLWKHHLNPTDWAIDATCGNGHDTLFLAGCCQVIGMDIQEQAIENTKKNLDCNQKTAELHRLSHDLIDTLVLPSPPRLIVYNLGYLPQGDKSITTHTETTLRSIQKSLGMIAVDGAISITCYPGHTEGEKEEQEILLFASQLCSKKWSVCHYRWLNRTKSPSLLWICRM